MRRHRRIRLCAVALLMLGALDVRADAPARVVSMNLCTDQLAGLLAAPGQLLSVSWLGKDPRYAPYAHHLEDIPANRGRAEEIWLIQPDLVLAGRFTTPETVTMLRDLGIEVALFSPITSLEAARVEMRRMGELLGRGPQAAEMIAAFDSRLAAIDGPKDGPRVLLYGALGSSSGADTLPGAILAAAGLRNIAAELGLGFASRLSLEEVVLQAPDVILIGQPYGAPARATEILAHPALSAVTDVRRIPEGGDWSCPTPALADAVAAMAALARELEHAP